MHMEFLVEEESAEAALRILIPRILGAGISFAVHVFQGKRDLLGKLPSRLRGYRRWLPDDWRIVVLVDGDQEDCRELKRKLEQIALEAGLLTRSRVRSGAKFQVLNRLAIEELEAWFFGDCQALAAAYPKLPPGLGGKSRYRAPDSIKGGTWEALERILQRAGYYPSGMPKTEVARCAAEHMDPKRNTSPSFRLFKRSLKEMAV